MQQINENFLLLFPCWCRLRQRRSDKEVRVIEGLQAGSGEETLCPIIKRVWRDDSVQWKVPFQMEREKGLELFIGVWLCKGKVWRWKGLKLSAILLSPLCCARIQLKSISTLNFSIFWGLLNVRMIKHEGITLWPFWDRKCVQSLKIFPKSFFLVNVLKNVAMVTKAPAATIELCDQERSLKDQTREPLSSHWEITLGQVIHFGDHEITGRSLRDSGNN